MPEGRILWQRTLYVELTGQFCGETAVLLQCFSECFLVYILIFTMGFKQLLGK